jgi:histidinol-phosphate aminotransferase
MGYSLPASRANFLLAKSPRVDGKELYAALKARGILVRHLSDEKIAAYIRITIGTPEQMDKLLDALREIEKEAAR